MSNTAKNFDILVTSSSVLHNYFYSPIKLFSDLYPTEFSAKPFFPCSAIIYIEAIQLKSNRVKLRAKELILRSLLAVKCMVMHYVESITCK